MWALISGFFNLHEFSRLGRERPQVYHREAGIVQQFKRFGFRRLPSASKPFMYNCCVTLNLQNLTQRLSDLPLGPMRYFDRVGSTNVEAARWVEEGAPDLALVLADEQLTGKGRHGRNWLTPPGGALAFSLVVRPAGGEADFSSSLTLMRLTALGTLAVCAALESEFQLHPEIKWPNDVLLEGRKTCGVLAEALWQGERLSAAILGIGINIAANSAPPDEQVAFPATYLEYWVGRPVDRLTLLHSVLSNLLDWRQRLDSPGFIGAWDQRLAFKNEWVQIMNDNDPLHATTSPGRLIGLDDQGRLILKDQDGNPFKLLTGELRLRPAGSQPGHGA